MKIYTDSFGNELNVGDFVVTVSRRSWWIYQLTQVAYPYAVARSIILHSDDYTTKDVLVKSKSSSISLRNYIKLNTTQAHLDALNYYASNIGNTIVPIPVLPSEVHIFGTLNYPSFHQYLTT